MVLLEKIANKFQLLDEFLHALDEIGKTPATTFLQDKIKIGSAKYYLQVSIECCLDVANHIIASERFRAPKNYADSFIVLEEEKIIPKELGMKLRQISKFRNRLVHLYGEIDDKYVYAYITGELSDIKEFKSIVVKNTVSFL